MCLCIDFIIALCIHPSTPSQLVGVALAEACDCNNEEAMALLLSRWAGKCTAVQAQPLLRAFAARGDAPTVGKLLGQGPSAMVQMDRKQQAQALKNCLMIT